MHNGAIIHATRNVRMELFLCQRARGVCALESSSLVCNSKILYVTNVIGNEEKIHNNYCALGNKTHASLTGSPVIESGSVSGSAPPFASGSAPLSGSGSGSGSGTGKIVY